MSRQVQGAINSILAADPSAAALPPAELQSRVEARLGRGLTSDERIALPGMIGPSGGWGAGPGAPPPHLARPTDPSPAASASTEEEVTSPGLPPPPISPGPPPGAPGAWPSFAPPPSDVRSAPRLAWLIPAVAVAVIVLVGVVAVLARGGSDDDSAGPASSTQRSTLGGEQTATTRLATSTTRPVTTTTVRTTTTTPATSSTTAAPGSRTGTIRWTALATGDCLRSLPPEGATFQTVDLAACDQSHEAEVFHSGQLSAVDVTLGGPGPTAAGVCDAQFRAYTGRAASGSGFNQSYFLAEAPGTGTTTPVPTIPSGNRYRLICLLAPSLGGTVAGSARS